MAINAGRIRKSVRRVRKFIKKSPKRPGVEQVHDLRTNSRRIETAIQVFGLKSKNERRSLHELARVRKRAGEVRDIDVLIGYVLASPPRMGNRNVWFNCSRRWAKNAAGA